MRSTRWKNGSEGTLTRGTDRLRSGQRHFAVHVDASQWIAVAVAEKMGVAETAADLFKRRAGRATGDVLTRVLRRAPKSRPDSEDSLEREGAVDPHAVIRVV
jgi:transposase